MNEDDQPAHFGSIQRLQCFGAGNLTMAGPDPRGHFPFIPCEIPLQIQQARCDSTSHIHSMATRTRSGIQLCDFSPTAGRALLSKAGG